MSETPRENVQAAETPRDEKQNEAPRQTRSGGGGRAGRKTRPENGRAAVSLIFGIAALAAGIAALYLFWSGGIAAGSAWSYVATAGCIALGIVATTVAGNMRRHATSGNKAAGTAARILAAVGIAVGGYLLVYAVVVSLVAYYSPESFAPGAEPEAFKLIYGWLRG